MGFQSTVPTQVGESAQYGLCYAVGLDMLVQFGRNAIMMTAQAHFYDTSFQWITQRRGELRASGLPSLNVSTPPEFKGEPGFWTPEHLFVAAAESCLMATFLGIAENSKLPVASYRSSAKGKLEWMEGAGLRFTEIAIFSEVELEAAKDRERAIRVMARAEKNCLIANSMNVLLRVEPKFLVRSAVAA
jgi:organic hydroperoxide reductase OsmC/OhrA